MPARKTKQKSKYDTHVMPRLAEIAAWAKEGADNQELARKLGVSYAAFRGYLAKGEEGDERYSALCATVAAAREEPNGEVEAALYKKCLGYNAKVVKHYKVKVVKYNADGKRVAEREELVEAEDEVHIPADTNAQMFYLANRMPDKWQYRPERREGDEDGNTGVVQLPAVMEPQSDGGVDA